ncbi:MAG: hypothetical protein KBE04_01855 [Phycisphaerae bacterium]|nr:hypothetical protein [Phycisphaerae bacterium]
MKQRDAVRSAVVSRQTILPMDVVTLHRSVGQEFFVTAVPTATTSVAACVDQALGFVKDQGAQVLSMDLHTCEASESPDLPDCPTTFLTGSVPPLEGVHVWALRGPQVRLLERAGRVIGSCWEDLHGLYVRMAGVIPSDARAPGETQAAEVLEVMKATLAECGMAFSDVVRTWFYNDRITAWYPAFNRARTAFFRANRVFDGLVPASTGIGSSNIHGTALVAGLLALRPKDGAIQVMPVVSPLQRPALEYGSSFSRAVEVAFPDHRRLIVSGTASIDPEGRTCHVGDPAGQTDLTMRVVDRILTSRGCTWSAVTRSIVYVKQAALREPFEGYLRRHQMPAFPAVLIRNDVCRDDLLFEIECDAILPRA